MGPCDNVVLRRPNENGTEGLSSSNGTHYARQNRRRARWSFRALPVSIGSISLSSCQLFLYARQIVADDGDGNRGWRSREREKKEREETREKQGDKLILLLRQKRGVPSPPRLFCTPPAGAKAR